jgi:shikimate 5-dehydrogenase
MLLEQGALAFEWWLGIAAPRDVMRSALTAALRQ